MIPDQLRKYGLQAIVVDDDYNTTEIFSELLSLIGINVIGKGYDGNDGVTLYQNLKPNIVFLDVMMDKYDGIYALEEIRKSNPDAIVIMVTADLRSDTENKLSELRASSIIYKPFDIDALIEVIQRAIIPLIKNNSSYLNQDNISDKNNRISCML